MGALLRRLFVVLVAWPVAVVLIGIHVRHRERLPARGPAIVAANHNSHLDTLTLLSLFPLSIIPRVRPVAAADYFLSNRLLAWISTRLVGILPIARKARKTDPLLACYEALQRGEILIVFPEGSRGEPETMGELKTGIAHLAERHPDVPVVPVFMHGLGLALPKGEALLVPRFCDVYVGEAIRWTGERGSFMHALHGSLEQLGQQHRRAQHGAGGAH
ncbi:MAG: lysophospholipid acyltransferase family protein [Gammaproteobacteria bacterium]